VQVGVPNNYARNLHTLQAQPERMQIGTRCAWKAREQNKMSNEHSFFRQTSQQFTDEKICSHAHKQEDFFFLFREATSQAMHVHTVPGKV
jgi:hypothetical protein